MERVKIFLESIAYVSSLIQFRLYDRKDNISIEAKTLIEEMYEDMCKNAIQLMQDAGYSTIESLDRQVFVFQDVELLLLEIEENFNKSDRFARAYIEDIVRICKHLDRGEKSYRSKKRPFLSVIYMCDNKGIAPFRFYRGYDNFKEYFDRICQNWGYGNPLGTTSSTLYVKDSTYAFNHTPFKPTEANNPKTTLLIDNIIISENKEQSKDIIKRVMKGVTNQGACIAIRALIKVGIISQKGVYRADIYRAIEQLIETKIGSASGINKYWTDDTLESKIKVITKQIEQQIKQK